MCGIAGFIGADGLANVERMMARLRHRGPDDQGTWLEDGVALGHTRLAILDLSSAGHQPMVFGDLVITYNGEIYNYRELRSRLPGPFKSQTDTEVVLHLYHQYGERCVQMLEGMFAFAIWDKRRRRLFAARDPLGIKPFVYRADARGFAFGSELKALLALGSPPVKRDAIRDFLAYGYIPAPKTAFEGLAKLPAGHSLTWEDGRIALERYWSPPAEVRVTDLDDASDQLDELLARVVREQLVSDVPIGVFLSSGIDSAAVSSYAGKVLTFTLGFDRADRSEVAGARILAEHLRVEHREATAQGLDLDEALRTIPAVYDEPFGDSAAWSNFLVCKLARPLVTVALSGEGGDELFCGYPRYWKEIGANSNLLTRSLAGVLPPLSRAGHSMQRRAANGLAGYAAAMGSLTPLQIKALLHPDYLEQEYDDLWFYRAHWREDLHPVQRMRWLDLHTNLPEGLLVKVDRASMAHSLEVRPPLLDRRLVEFALGLHPELLIDSQAHRGKKILRRLLAPRLPAGYLDRRKSGFGLPIHSWVRRRRDTVNAAVRRLMDLGILKRPVSAEFRRIWSLLVLDQWLAAR